ncbi:Gfo/Idh/MocA family oxidoreductase [Zobellia galactanivorans]|uniref:NAD(P)-dependent dehydrogenase n=1 Tax=Zobellia galactanivorans (strain DSM 12802 / CCUG 47099 / CIP 106680 / NCIMB 13871 / Dsij) TaxID=63186 RepID=G0KZY6_ZOBGA|nr:Gfo/Idh/MocA family oxidoreductase [Zobellia galactanivorans]MDO6810702.1 Gfo/Idh/MocA family oxidoreductase [Zobellia galactanivorans]CAZ97261.1 NAD(P)-dependent dehydrogenase [Zobellia galactanivorans]
MERRKFINRTALSTAALVGFPSIVPAHVLGKNAPSNKINIGQIGCGRIARSHDIHDTIRFDQANYLAVCDVDSKRAADAKLLVDGFYQKKTGKAKYNRTKIYDDYREMLLNKDIDAVVISTPDHWHSQPAMEAALAGKDIYVQKPTSLTVREGQQLREVVQKTGAILQVGTQQRAMPQFRIAAELVRNGRIGKIHTVKIGLPGDPAGPEAPAMPVPPNLNFDMWLGSTPEVPYTEIGVHPQDGYSRPGWLRSRNYGAGMITGWGQHHYDSAAWGMNTELSGPISVEALAEFPKSGLWNVHGDFFVKHEYDNGITVYTSGGYTNGIRYEGTDGWIFVSRGSYQASATDPVDKEKSSKALNASDPKILESVIGENEIHLEKIDDQHGNWLDCIKTRKAPISPIEKGHKACTICLISDIAMQFDRKLEWDYDKEVFINDAEANAMLHREQRKPYGTDYVKY